MSTADGPATRPAMTNAVGTPPPAAARGGTGQPAKRHRLVGREPTWWWMAGYAAAGVALFFCYLQISSTQGVTSDGASNALQAWDMLHGNWLLRGWTVSDVSFYTTELPEYVLVEIIRGLGPVDVHVAAALSYTLLVVLAGLLAKGRATGLQGLVRVLIASGIMLAPEVGPGAFILLLSPDHTGTGVPLLLIFFLLDRAPHRWYVPVIAGLLLVWVQVGDRLATLIGVLPIVAVCAVRAYQGIVQRREPLRSRWFEFALGAAAIVSVPVTSSWSRPSGISAGTRSAAGDHLVRRPGGMASAPRAHGGRDLRALRRRCHRLEPRRAHRHGAAARRRPGVGRVGVRPGDPPVLRLGTTSIVEILHRR